MKRTLAFASLLTAVCVLLAVVTLSLSGCSSINIINPSYSLRGVSPRVNLGIPPSVDLDLVVGVDNPNPVALRLDRFDFDLFVNNDMVLNNVRSDQGIQIPARGFGDVHLNAHLNYSNMQAIYRQVVDLIQGNRASYELRGNAYYNTPIGQMRFPVLVTR